MTVALNFDPQIAPAALSNLMGALESSVSLQMLQRQPRVGQCYEMPYRIIVEGVSQVGKFDTDCYLFES